MIKLWIHLPLESGSTTFVEGFFNTAILLISLEKMTGSSWKFLRQIYRWTRTSSSNFGTRSHPDSGHGTHSYFCLNCPTDLDRVLNIPYPVPLRDLWPWPKFRQALHLWSISCLFFNINFLTLATIPTAEFFFDKCIQSIYLSIML